MTRYEADFDEGTPAVPGEVTQAAYERRLGELRQILAPGRRSRLLFGWGVLAGISLLLSLMVTAAGSSNDAQVVITLLAVFWGITVVLLGIFGWQLARSPLVSAKARSLHMYRFEHGFVQMTVRGAQVYRWDAIRTVYQSVEKIRAKGLPLGTRHEYSVLFADGSRLNLTDVATDMENFGPVLLQEVARVQLPKALAYLRSGNPIVLGRLTLTKSGIGSGGDEIAWSWIDRVEIVDGVLRFSAGGSWLASPKTPARAVPNLYTLLAIVEQMRRPSTQVG
ncbi:hypothetical protein Rhe02_44650 [Rhizocola hellebori]|uniref:Uncharacterized protein n=1 Tax=Rhizocola hellebori TaxID=1392758 RepID=A0A8J3QB01_9ACTN|nr:DUF6585 family protein [Rhizocola hellebori]GIH06398.1 hypothetical protein Rhe02_44650 [Rhizocola hellebori]